MSILSITKPIENLYTIVIITEVHLILYIFNVLYNLLIIYILIIIVKDIKNIIVKGIKSKIITHLLKLSY